VHTRARENEKKRESKRARVRGRELERERAKEREERGKRGNDTERGDARMNMRGCVCVFVCAAACIQKRSCPRTRAFVCKKEGAMVSKWI